MILIILAYIFSSLSLLMSFLLFIRIKAPWGFILLPFKSVAMGLSRFWAIMSTVGAIIGLVFQAFWAVLIGIIGTIIMTIYVWRCTRDNKGFENAFGANWSDLIRPEQANLMVQKRGTWFLKTKTSPKPSWERDVPFWTISGRDRQLLCDIWRPTDGKISGLAFIFFHGSGWGTLDKDRGTRPFFRHLVAQGHTVMDVAYRLIPEVDIYGMIGDVKRAIAWMKANADHYGVDPEKIVLGGASAGAHLALLAGYAPKHPELTPEDLKKADLSVCGIISYYGSTDLVAGYERYGWEDKNMPPEPIGADQDHIKPVGSYYYAGRVDLLLGGLPEEVPDMYQLACPTTHVRPGCPPTLLMQGARDFIVPMVGTQDLYAKLVESGVPVINVVFPWTDHAFDLILPQFSPPAQSALYNVDRFLALMVNKDLWQARENLIKSE
ncbi:MAG: alpha/beta hydrolase fold domain-containing protein [Candidatus Hermodarchaeota archaeon]